MKQLKICLTLLIILMEIEVSAQQEPTYSQYFFNNSVINPAQAGASGSNQAGILVRNQWVGIDGAPKTHYGLCQFKTARTVGTGSRPLSGQDRTRGEYPFSDRHGISCKTLPRMVFMREESGLQQLICEWASLKCQMLIPEIHFSQWMLHPV